MQVACASLLLPWYWPALPGWACEMKKLPAQPEDQRCGPVTYRAEIFVKGEGEELRLGTQGHGGTIPELAEDLVAKASELEAEAKATQDVAETENVKRQRAERSGRRHRSWE